MILLCINYLTIIGYIFMHRSVPSVAIEIKRISVLDVIAVEGGTAALSCDIKHPQDDSVYLVLWFNDNLTIPIYRYDMRYGEDEPSSHWRDSNVLGNRGTLSISKRLAELRISPVKEKDEGFYKCRVDFRKHPTKTTRINLRIIIPPKEMRISHAGQEVSSVIGPLKVGDVAQILCSVYGGRPSPKIYWYFGDQLVTEDIKGEVKTSPSKAFDWPNHKKTVVESTLSIGPLLRSDLRKMVTCEATNTNLTSPLSTVFMVDMNLPPLSIEIKGITVAISAGRQYVLTCEVIGSRPPPSITWLKGSTRVQGEPEITSTDGNLTRSSYRFLPTPPDDGTTITCLAKNSAIQSSIHKITPVSVNYVPEAQIEMASFLDKKNIKEGDDVFFECTITANPKVYKVSFQHNGIMLDHKISMGIIIINQSLVIQKVQRKNAGAYSCTASNIEGDGTSKSVMLDIKFAPVCGDGQLATYGVAKKEDAEITCRVNANPKAKNFRWRFNNTADTIDVPTGRYTTTQDSSIITYTPVTELDFGTLLCWADNVIGVQEVPCVFHIVPAGRPDPPTNCSITKRTASSFSVWCQAGFDGGLHQVFHIRISTSNGWGANYTSGEPIFQLDKQNPGTSYRINVWASNSKGSSVPVHLTAFTLNKVNQAPSHGPSEAELKENSSDRNSKKDSSDFAQKESKNSKLHEVKWDLSGFIPIICGATVGGVLLLIVLSLVVRHSVKGCFARSSNEDIHHHCQSSATMLIQSRHSGSSTACENREIQIESEDLFEREHALSIEVDASGPLIQPPSSYGGDAKNFRLIQGAPVGHFSESPRSGQNEMIRYLPTAGNNAVPLVSSSVTNCPSLQRTDVRQQLMHMPRYSNETSRTDSITNAYASLQSTRYVKDVPTVYATIGNRNKKADDCIQHAHSYASLESAFVPEVINIAASGHLRSRDIDKDRTRGSSLRQSLKKTDSDENKRESSV